ncbi:MAG: HDOD domain-containing protein [Pirellulales bacterium]|nr:HDOD domain-containing protein [Pirellulales bacterium]
MSAAPTTTPPTFQQLLANAQLPALPQSAIRLMELSRDPNKGPADFAVPIEADAGLTGQILKFVNSAYFGFSREISNIKMAITLVGIRTIKNFALWSAVFSLMPNPKCGPFDLKRLWQDSLRRALFARAFAKQKGMKDAEEVFAAALLQDMAVPLLAKEKSKDYLELLETRAATGKRLSELEQERFGFQHAEVAGAMSRSWKMPESFALMLDNHVDLQKLMTESHPDVGSISVALSAYLPSCSDNQWGECGVFDQFYQQLKDPRGPSVPEFLALVDKEYTDFAPVLKLPAPSKTLLASYEESLTEAAL